MCKLQDATNLSLTRLILILVFTAQLLDSTWALSDQRLCADPDCKKIISHGTGKINYRAGNEGTISFNINSNIRIKSKSAGKDHSLWGIEVNGREGYAPKEFIQENKIIIGEKYLKHYVDVKPINKVNILSTSEKSVEQENTIETTKTTPLNEVPIESTEKPLLNNSNENFTETPAVATPVFSEVVDGTQIQNFNNDSDGVVETVQKEVKPFNSYHKKEETGYEDEIGDYDDDEEVDFQQTQAEKDYLKPLVVDAHNNVQSSEEVLNNDNKVNNVTTQEQVNNAEDSKIEAVNITESPEYSNNNNSPKKDVTSKNLGNLENKQAKNLHDLEEKQNKVNENQVNTKEIINNGNGVNNETTQEQVNNAEDSKIEAEKITESLEFSNYNNLSKKNLTSKNVGNLENKQAKNFNDFEEKPNKVNENHVNTQEKINDGNQVKNETTQEQVNNAEDSKIEAEKITESSEYSNNNNSPKKDVTSKNLGNLENKQAKNLHDLEEKQNKVNENQVNTKEIINNGNGVNNETTQEQVNNAEDSKIEAVKITESPEYSNNNNNSPKKDVTSKNLGNLENKQAKNFNDFEEKPNKVNENHVNTQEKINDGNQVKNETTQEQVNNAEDSKIEAEKITESPEYSNNNNSPKKDVTSKNLGNLENKQPKSLNDLEEKQNKVNDNQVNTKEIKNNGNKVNNETTQEQVNNAEDSKIEAEKITKSLEFSNNNNLPKKDVTSKNLGNLENKQVKSSSDSVAKLKIGNENQVNTAEIINNGNEVSNETTQEQVNNAEDIKTEAAKITESLEFSNNNNLPKEEVTSKNLGNLENKQAKNLKDSGEKVNTVNENEMNMAQVKEKKPSIMLPSSEVMSNNISMDKEVISKSLGLDNQENKVEMLNNSETQQVLNEKHITVNENQVNFEHVEEKQQNRDKPQNDDVNNEPKNTHLPSEYSEQNSAKIAANELPINDSPASDNITTTVEYINTIEDKIKQINDTNLDNTETANDQNLSTSDKIVNAITPTESQLNNFEKDNLTQHHEEISKIKNFNYQKELQTEPSHHKIPASNRKLHEQVETSTTSPPFNGDESTTPKIQDERHSHEDNVEEKNNPTSYSPYNDVPLNTPQTSHSDYSTQVPPSTDIPPNDYYAQQYTDVFTESSHQSSDSFDETTTVSYNSVPTSPPETTSSPPLKSEDEQPKALPSLTPPFDENKENKGLFATIMGTVNNVLSLNKKTKHNYHKDGNELNRILFSNGNGHKNKIVNEEEYCKKLGLNGDCPESEQNHHYETDSEHFHHSSSTSIFSSDLTFDTFLKALAVKILEISELLAFLVIVAAASLFFIFGYYCFCNSSREGALLSKLNQLESSLLASHKENAILKHNLMSTRQKLASIEDNSFGSNDMVVSLRKELEDELMEKARLQEQITVLQKELENAADAGIELNKIVSELLSNQTGDESIISSVEELQKQLNEQQNTILEINASLAEKSRENSELQLLIAEQNARYERELADVRGDNDELEHEKGNLLTRLDELKNDFDKDITAALEGKNLEIKRLQNEIVDLSNKLENEHTKWQTSVAKIEALEECLKNVRKDPSVNINEVIDVAYVKAQFIETQKKNMLLKERLEIELDQRKLADNQLQMISSEVEKLKQDFNQSEKDKLEAQTRLEVLSNYFKDKENQLQKELSLKEAMWLKQQGETTTTVDRLTAMQEEIQSLKSQNDSLRAEIEAQVAAHKAQTGTLENRAHETWLAARQSDRRYEEARAEATALRRQLTALAGGNVSDVNKSTAGLAGLGDELTQAPSPIHMESPGSPMLGRMPPPPFLPPPFMGHPPPPFMGMPPPPPFVPPGEMRPAPLGRIMSPPPQRSGRFSPQHLDYEDYMDYESNNTWHRHTYSPPPRTYRSLSPTDSRHNYSTERDLISTYDTETDFSPPPSPRESRRRGGHSSERIDNNNKSPYGITKKFNLAHKGPLSSGSEKSFNTSLHHDTRTKKGNPNGGGGKNIV